MSDKTNMDFSKQMVIVYAVLTIIALAVFWPVTQHEFSNTEEAFHVTENTYIRSGITLEGIQWAFSNTSAGFWHPLTWVSLMLDSQIYGLNAFGYNLTNLILHILSTLLLFNLFNRMTGDIWKSAFAAALFAFHPLQLALFESIHQRKEFLSMFFCMLTLCLYVYYTGKPVIRRHVYVVLSFICALLSKPVVAVLPVILILLDYWPLGRFQSQKGNLVFWQLKEKFLFYILSAIFSIITIYTHYNPTISTYCPAGAKIANISAAYLFRLQQFFLYPFEIPLLGQLSVWKLFGPVLLMIVISFVIITAIKRLPYLFVGWLWFIVTSLPFIVIFQCGHADLIWAHYTGLEFTGIIIMLVWGIPQLFPGKILKTIILFPAAIAFITLLTVTTWQMSSYCKNTVTALSSLLQVTNDNYIMHNNLGIALISDDRKEYNFSLLIKALKFRLAFPNENKLNNAIDYYNRIINRNPDDALAYNNRGTVYNKLGRHELAFTDYNQAIKLKPGYSTAYSNRGVACYMQGLTGKFCSEEQSYGDFEKACSLGNCSNLKLVKILKFRVKTDNPNITDNRWAYYYQRVADFFNNFRSPKFYDAQTYNVRGINSSQHGRYKSAIDNFSRAIFLQPDFVDAYNNRGLTFSQNGHYQLAIEDFNRIIRLKPDFASAYINRGATYMITNKKELGCLDAQTACELGNCELLKMANKEGHCR